MDLKKLILQAYGTCDFLSHENNIEMRSELSTFLLWYVYFLYGRDSVNSFASHFLLVGQDDLDHFIDMALAHYSKEKMEAAGRQLYDDFVWADELLNQYHPGFNDRNTRLFVEMVQAVAKSSPYNGKVMDYLTQEEPEVNKTEREKGAQALAQLNRLYGLDSVKEEIKRLISLIQIGKVRAARGLKAPQVSYHMVFLGNPGTGKTTVARLIGKIYKDLGVLEKGQMIETDRAGLVAGFVGQTALKTQEVINKAIGGVLFIDEAYTLNKESKNDFGQEAIETLLKAMEDHRNNLVVIVAGYPDLMMEFLHSNPGLSSRFNKFITFDNYSASQLCHILHQMALDQDYDIEEETLNQIEVQLETLLQNPPEHFGNARTMRNVLETAITNQALRLQDENDLESSQLRTLKAADFENTI